MSDELFQLAVSLIRRGYGYVDLTNELEQAARTPMDVRDVINSASKFVAEMQTTSFAAAIEAAHRGESHFEISKKLVKLGFHPYDSDLIAARAMAKAEARVGGRDSVRQMIWIPKKLKNFRGLRAESS